MALDAGVLSVTVEFAKGLKDTDFFSKIDPYAVLKVGNQTLRTATLPKAGTSPVWNETFSFNIINENSLEITFFDEDVASDDNLGTATIPLAKVRTSKDDKLQASIIRNTSKKQGGFVSVSLKFDPNDNLKPKPHAPADHAHAPVHIPPGYAPVQVPQGYAPMPNPPYGPAHHTPCASPYPPSSYAPHAYAPGQYFQAASHPTMPQPHLPQPQPQYHPMPQPHVHAPSPYGSSPYGPYA